MSWYGDLFHLICRNLFETIVSNLPDDWQFYFKTLLPTSHRVIQSPGSGLFFFSCHTTEFFSMYVNFRVYLLLVCEIVCACVCLGVGNQYRTISFYFAKPRRLWQQLLFPIIIILQKKRDVLNLDRNPTQLKLRNKRKCVVHKLKWVKVALILDIAVWTFKWCDQRAWEFLTMICVQSVVLLHCGSVCYFPKLFQSRFPVTWFNYILGPRTEDTWMRWTDSPSLIHFFYLWG